MPVVANVSMERAFVVMGTTASVPGTDSALSDGSRSTHNGVRPSFVATCMIECECVSEYMCQCEYMNCQGSTFPSSETIERAIQMRESVCDSPYATRTLVKDVFPLSGGPRINTLGPGPSLADRKSVV